MITNNNDLSGQLSCQYFQRLVKNGKSRDGALMAQTGGGGNAKFGPLIVGGGRLLLQAINSEQTRENFVTALNYARAKGIHQNSIPSKGGNAFTKFWSL